MVNLGPHISLWISNEVSLVPAHTKTARYAAIPPAIQDRVPSSLYRTDCIGQMLFLHPGAHSAINSSRLSRDV